MRIDKIEICNLTSLEGVQVIDFTQEPLRSAGLFAITGSTGSGKSTLLDAICLALYNKAPRYDSSEIIKNLVDMPDDDSKNDLRNNDTRNILRRGCQEAYSKVTFSLPDGSIYEAGWSLRLKRTGTYDRVQRSLRQLKPHREDYDPREINHMIVDLIHLDYSQFTRTVILAQNSFANFLNASQDDKSMLLEKLTGTTIYGSISKRIFEETSKADTTYQEILKVMEGIALRKMGDEELTKLNEMLALNKGQLTRDNNLLERIGRQLQWYADYDKAQQEQEKQKQLQFAAQRAYNALYDKKQLLDRYDKVLTFQPLYHTIKETEQEINKFKDFATLKQKELREHKENVAQISHDNDIAQGRLQEAKDMYDHQLPLLNRGHDLQGQISVFEQELANKRTDLEHLREDMKTHNEDFVNSKSELDTCTKQQASISLRMHAIAMHRPLIEHMETVKARLQKMYELKSDTEHCVKLLSQYNKERQEQLSLEGKMGQQEAQLKSDIKSLQEELIIHHQANQGLNTVDIQSRISRLADLARRSRSALDLWRRISKGFADVEDKADEIRRRESSIAQIAKDIELIRQRTVTLNEVRDRLRTSFMLSQSDNIKELRQQLKEGSACPVCGATHHPYHSETEQELGEILSRLESDYRAAESDANQALMQMNDKQRRQSDEQGRLTIERQYFGKMKEQLAEDVESWKDYAELDTTFADCTPSVNRENRKTLITQLLESYEQELKKEQDLNDSYNQHQAAINDINDKIRKTNDNLSENFRKLSEVQAEKRVLESRIAELQERQEQNDVDLGGLFNEVDEIITLPLWKEKWRDDYDAFMQRLTDLAEEWNTDNEKFQAEKQNEFRLQEKVNALQTWLNDRMRTTAELQNRIAILVQQIETKQQSLRQMFGERSLDEFTESLQNAIRTNTLEAENCRKKYEAAIETLQQLNGQMDNLDAQRTRREDDLQKYRSELDIRISRFNNDNSTLQYFELEKLFSDSRDWNALRAEIDTRRKELEEVNFRYDAASKVILTLQQADARPSEDQTETEIALRNSQDFYQNHRQEVTVKIADAETRLRMHEACLKELEAYEPQKAQLAATLDEWRKLNSIIGSADGKRFREIAQCYTFRFLVGYANQQLQQLTQRYRLRNKPGTLGLEIIDRDMFDEVRHVNSLSGGETFIVSLGLALGLSSLHSQNLIIGSLFIDEGFGNLDSANLDMVIDALSNLQNSQGRKVGVISHTEQVRSRISPKIHLVKYASGGKSRVEIKA